MINFLMCLIRIHAKRMFPFTCKKLEAIENGWGLQGCLPLIKNLSFLMLVYVERVNKINISKPLDILYPLLLQLSADSRKKLSIHTITCAFPKLVFATNSERTCVTICHTRFHVQTPKTASFSDGFFFLHLKTAMYGK